MSLMVTFQTAVSFTLPPSPKLAIVLQYPNLGHLYKRSPRYGTVCGCCTWTRYTLERVTILVPPSLGLGLG